MVKEEDKTLFMLINDVNRQFGHKIRDIEKNQGHGTCASCILMELDKNGSLTQVELVDRIYMRPSSVSVALQKLEAEGLITRETKDDDLRYTFVTLTNAGKTHCDLVKKSIQKLDENMTQKLDQDEVETIKKILLKMSASFKEESNENI